VAGLRRRKEHCPGLVLCDASFQVSISLHSGYTRLRGRAHSDTLYLKARTYINMHILEAVWSDLHFVCIQASQGFDFPYTTEMI